MKTDTIVLHGGEETPCRYNNHCCSILIAMSVDYVKDMDGLVMHAPWEYLGLKPIGASAQPRHNHAHLDRVTYLTDLTCSRWVQGFEVC